MAAKALNSHQHGDESLPLIHNHACIPFSYQNTYSIQAAFHYSVTYSKRGYINVDADGVRYFTNSQYSL